MAVLVINDTFVKVQGISTSPTLAHTLIAAGTNGLVVAIFMAVRFTFRVLDSVTLDGVAGTVIGGTGIDGGVAVTHYAAYWPVADHPGAGTFDLIPTWSNNMETTACVLVELSGVDQSALVGDIFTNETTAGSDPTVLGTTVTGANGKFVMLAGCTADGLESTTPTGTTQPTGTVFLSDQTVINTASAGDGTLVVAYDPSAASASETYDWSLGNNGTSEIDSLAVLSFAINASADEAFNFPFPDRQRIVRHSGRFH